MQNETLKMFLVQWELDGIWHTIAKRSDFKAACAKARAEYRAMRGAHMTAVIGSADVDAPILRRTMENNFTL